MTRPVHVVVVHTHGVEDLDRALAAAGTAQPVTVVDNSRSDAVRRVCEVRGARYLRATENRGFAAGNNVALREILAGEPCDVLLLNPDAFLPDGAIPTLAAALASDGRAAAATPKLVHMSGEPQREVWPYPSPWRAWLEAVGLGRFSRGAGFAVGTVLLLRWEALQQVGLFDERFFVYAEETDWQRRAREYGWHPIVCSGLVATHIGGGTMEPSRRERIFYASQELYIRKWYGSTGWLLYRLAVISGAGIRALVLRGPRRAHAGRRLVIYLRGPCRAAAGPG